MRQGMKEENRDMGLEIEDKNGGIKISNEGHRKR